MANNHLETSFPPLPAVEPDEGKPQLDLASLFLALRKHWAVALAACVAVTLGVTFYTLGQKKIYAAKSTVMFDPAPPRPLGREVSAMADLSGTDYWTNQEYYATQLYVLKSRRVALAVVQELALDHDAGFLANAPAGAMTPPKEVPPDMAATVLLNRLSVEPIKNTRLAEITYEDADPQRAQRIALAIVDVYMAKTAEDAEASTSSAVSWLNEQVDKLKQSLDASEMDLYKFQLDKNVLAVDITSQTNMLRDEMTAFDQALTQARIKRVEIEARYSALQTINAQDPLNVPIAELMRSESLSKLRSQYLDAERAVNTLLAAGKGESHPDVKEARASQNLLRNALVTEIENIKGSVSHELAAARKQEAGLSGLIQEAKKQALDVNLLGIEYNRLNRNKENNEKLYSVVLERAKEGDLTRMMQIKNVRVVERPELPRNAVRPKVAANLAAGFGAGLALGLVAAAVLFLLDRSVKSQADIENALGLNFLGVLPLAGSESGKKGRYYGRYRAKQVKPGTSPELLVHEAPMSGTAEAARSIRTNIQFMSPDKPFRTLLVTSPGPSEGKTTVACTLAIAMAQAGQRVCLVDCDLRRPRLHRVFGKDSEAGLSAAILDPGTITDELLATDIPNLSVLPAGPLPPNPAELLQSERFATLLASLGERFDRVVIDSPPVVPVTDAVVLAAQVDGTVLVIRAAKTSRESVVEARRALTNVGGRIVGGLLNSVDVSRGGYAGYKYSYYRKGGYYRSSPETDATSG